MGTDHLRARRTGVVIGERAHASRLRAPVVSLEIENLSQFARWFSREVRFSAWPSIETALASSRRREITESNRRTPRMKRTRPSLSASPAGFRVRCACETVTSDLVLRHVLLPLSARYPGDDIVDRRRGADVANVIPVEAQTVGNRESRVDVRSDRISD